MQYKKEIIIKNWGFYLIADEMIQNYSKTDKI